MSTIRTSAVVTRRTMLGLTIGGLTATAIASHSAKGEALERREELYPIFKEHGAEGTFVLYDPTADRLVLVNAERARQRFVPASTFKITNSLIALETGVVKDADEVIPYGGKPQPIKAWEKDMPMREAIAVSNVPVYQELARRIGLDRYREWLDRLKYGNRQTGTVVDRFWLDGPLSISALEQARFVALLAQQKLDASARSQSIVRDILRLEEKGDAVLFAKTGWSGKIGWWTGWVERDGRPVAFSLNINMLAMSDAPKRLAISKALLAKLSVY